MTLKDQNPIDDVMGIVARGQNWDLTKVEGKVRLVRQQHSPEAETAVEDSRLASTLQMLRLERKHRLAAERKLRLLHLKLAGISLIPTLGMAAMSHHGLINKWLALAIVVLLTGYQIWAVWNAQAPKYMQKGEKHGKR